MARSVTFGTPVRLHVPIPMADGVTLSADLFLPDADALEAGRFPVGLRRLPVSQGRGWRACTRIHRSSPRAASSRSGSMSAAAGAPAAPRRRVHPPGARDGVDAIAWLATWSNGSVGHVRQLVRRLQQPPGGHKRPPALKAICPMYFTDNRYTDDCHYKGGAMQMMFDVGRTASLWSPRTPCRPARRPATTGRRPGRAPAGRALAARWIEHQTDDETGSTARCARTTARSSAATYLFGGWRDGYANCNLRTFEHLTCRRRCSSAPGCTPGRSGPGPARRLSTRSPATSSTGWPARQRRHGRAADHDLRPAVRSAGAADPTTPASGATRRTGRWRGRRRGRFISSSGGLLLAARLGDVDRHHRLQTGAWARPFGRSGGPSAVPLQPGDQRLEDAWSLNWTSAALTEPSRSGGGGDVPRGRRFGRGGEPLRRLIDAAPDAPRPSSPGRVESDPPRRTRPIAGRAGRRVRRRHRSRARPGCSRPATPSGPRPPERTIRRPGLRPTSTGGRSRLAATPRR